MRLPVLFGLSILVLSHTSCNEDDDGVAPQYRQRVYNYAFNDGQVSGKSQYAGGRPRTLMATLTVDELPPDSVRLTVALKNTQNGVAYPVGAYDATDTTGYSYSLTPNPRILATTLLGTGSLATTTRLVRYSYDSLLNYYNGYFIVRDLEAGACSADSLAPQSQLIIGTFAR